MPATATLKAKEVRHDLDELEDDEAEDDMLGKSSVSSNDRSGFVEDIPGESAVRAQKNLRRDMENKLAERKHVSVHISIPFITSVKKSWTSSTTTF